MKKVIALGLVFSFGLSLVVASSAEARGWGRHMGINAREARQQRRLYNGVQNGSLNKREYSRLERREGHLDAVEARDRRSGGGLSPSERRNLEHRENRLSRGIYNQKHDGQNAN